MGRLLKDPNNTSTKLVQRHRGVKVTKNQKNGYAVVWLHYSADPLKTQSWAEKARSTYPSLDKWNQEMEIDFTKSAGRRVFPMFKMETHVGKFSPIPNVPIWRFWDFGWHHPACVFAQVNGDGALYILEEMLGEDMTIEAFGREVLDFGQKRFLGHSYRDAGDPAGAQRNDKSKHSSIDILRHEFGIRVQSRKLLQSKGLGLMRALMLPAPGTGNGLYDKNGDPIPPVYRFFVSDRCEDIIDGCMGGYRLKEDSDDPEKDGYYDHIFDAIRYGCQVIFDHVTARVIQAPVIYRKKNMGTIERTTGY